MPVASCVSLPEDILWPLEQARRARESLPQEWPQAMEPGIGQYTLHVPRSLSAGPRGSTPVVTVLTHSLAPLSPFPTPSHASRDHIPNKRLAPHPCFGVQFVGGIH